MIAHLFLQNTRELCETQTSFSPVKVQLRLILWEYFSAQERCSLDRELTLIVHLQRKCSIW